MTEQEQKNSHRRKLSKRWWHALMLGVASILFLILIALFQPFYTINQWVSDQLLGTDNPSPNIIIAGIDDVSLKTYGKWSEWPRTLHIQAIDNLSKAGAKVIGYDVIFSESSADDSAFAASMSKAGNVVLAGAGSDIINQTSGVITFAEYLVPVLPLQQACAAIGHVDVVPDPDGKVRKIPLVIKDSTGKYYPSLSLAMLHSMFYVPIPETFSIKDSRLNMLAREIPVEGPFFLRLNFSEMNTGTPYVSYSDVIQGNFDPSLVKNKIVLIGMTATGDIDSWSIPTSSVRIPGVYLHAAAIDTILRQQYLVTTGLPVTLLGMFLLVMICALFLPRFGTWYWMDIIKGAALITGLLVLYVIISSLAAGRGYLMNILYPALLLLMLFTTNLTYIAIREQSDKRFVKTLFGRYVSPQVSQRIVRLANNGDLQLGGEERNVTILFADIRNFTKLSEQMTPAEIVKMLNTYLPALIEAIVDNGGIVNKFAGDNLMGVWNAPQPQADHAKLAVKAALEGQQKIIELAKSNPTQVVVQFGVGINTGTALAGNLGSIGRSEYTVIGDAVNLASRICGSAPGGETWIGPETYIEAKDFIRVEKLEPQVFKGKTTPVQIYRVMGWRYPDLPPVVVPLPD